MGSQAIQGHLWGQRPKDWAAIQEKTGKDGYVYVLAMLNFDEKKLLDIGCGSGLFSSLAFIHGADVTGIDASEPLIAEARQREPAVEFLTGEMEALPFVDDSFDLVSGFNSFQYAADVKNAFTEARRVLKDNGRLVVMIWGIKKSVKLPLI